MQEFNRMRLESTSYSEIEFDERFLNRSKRALREFSENSSAWTAGVAGGIFLFLVMIHDLAAPSQRTDLLYVFPILLAGVLGGLIPGLTIAFVGMAFLVYLDHGLHWVDVSRLASFAALLAMAIHVKSQLIDARKNSQTDYLTSLLNRAALETIGSEAFEIVRRRQQSLVVVVIDCDHFKAINDAHGHQAGDRLLQMLGRTFRQVIRRTDYAFRLGGDEFLLLLVGIPEVAVETVLRRIEMIFERKAGEVGHACSLSMGLASLQPETKNLHELIQEADEKMYSRKEHRKEAATPHFLS